MIKVSIWVKWLNYRRHSPGDTSISFWSFFALKVSTFPLFSSSPFEQLPFQQLLFPCPSFLSWQTHQSYCSESGWEVPCQSALDPGNEGMNGFWWLNPWSSAGLIGNMELIGMKRENKTVFVVLFRFRVLYRNSSLESVQGFWSICLQNKHPLVSPVAMPRMTKKPSLG